MGTQRSFTSAIKSLQNLMTFAIVENNKGIEIDKNNADKEMNNLRFQKFSRGFKRNQWQCEAEY